MVPIGGVTKYMYTKYMCMLKKGWQIYFVLKCQRGSGMYHSNGNWDWDIFGFTVIVIISTLQ